MKLPTGLPLPKIGLTLCLMGLAVAILSVVPGVVPKNTAPWPILVGSAIYFPGAFLAFFSTRGMDRRRVLNMLRFVRLGFIAVIVLLIFFVSRN